MSLEQVHVIGKNCRKLRLLWVVGCGIALALLPAVRAFGLTTSSTALSAQSGTQTCPTTGLTTTLTTLTITVTGSGGVPSGTVNIEDNATCFPGADCERHAQHHRPGDGFALPRQRRAHAAGCLCRQLDLLQRPVPRAASATISSQCNTQFAVSVSNISPSSSSVDDADRRSIRNGGRHGHAVPGICHLSEHDRGPVVCHRFLLGSAEPLLLRVYAGEPGAFAGPGCGRQQQLC